MLSRGLVFVMFSGIFGRPQHRLAWAFVVRPRVLSRYHSWMGEEKAPFPWVTEGEKPKSQITILNLRTRDYSVHSFYLAI